jgi:hypothetical protein
LQLSSHRWTQQTLQQVLGIAADVPSLERAVQHFRATTHVQMSKSSLENLYREYGGRLVQQQEQEAEALAQANAPDPEGKPDAETMAISLDGVMVHLREEGWKEVKVASVSAVEVQRGRRGEEVHLSHHSYRAGLWEAAVFAKQQWAESWRRGVGRAQRVVSVNDGAVWIWGIVLTCYAGCVEILDWWHAVQKVWMLVWGIYPQGSASALQWGAQLKEWLWGGNLRAICHFVREAWPRGKPLPDDLRQAVGYLFRNRRRMRYALFRQEGYPVGSGTVESACKVVVESRLGQAGMRWSRAGAQAMLALRCALLSERWEATWQSLAPKPT